MTGCRWMSAGLPAPNRRACARALEARGPRAAGGPSAGRWPPGPPPTTLKPSRRPAARPGLDDLALFCHLHHHYFIHILGWTITGDPNGTLHFTHPGGWLTLDSPLPGADRLAA